VKSGSNRSTGRQRSIVTSTRLSVAVQGLAGKDSLPESERNEYRRLVQLLIRTHKTASQPFLFPVPETVIGYYDIIKKPVDLTTIRQRLDSNNYSTRSEFEQDFLQMIWNAYIFNPPSSEVFRSAMELHAAFVIGLQRSVIALNDQRRSEAYGQIEAARKRRQTAARRMTSVESSKPARSSTSAAPSNRKSTSTEEELRKKLEFLQRVVSKQAAATKRPVGPTQTRPEQVRPLTEKQLDQLATDLEELDPKFVPQVASILRGEPTATIADGQLDLSIHELPPLKQRELLRLMDKLKTQEAVRGRLNERVREYGSDSEDSSYSKRPRY
jgi:bromodomain-containing factor 1